MSALEGLAIRRLRRAARDGARTTEDERFRALIENHSDVVSLVDTQGRIGFLTPSSARVLGHDPGELEGRSLFESVHPDDTLRVRAFLDSALTQPGVTRPVEWRARRSDGGWVHLETIGNNLLDDPAVGHLVLFSRDIGERKAFETQLAHQAFHDPLTGLANRSLLKDRVQRALLRDGEPCSLLFLDLDNFKHVNDSLGHDAGDTLLVEVSDRIRQCLRPGDTAARLGGDEFAILLENAHAVDDAVRVAERITDLLQAPITVGARTAFTATSVG
ncbi:MAG: diguanylate cyclase domain-containing protein, partial [Gaiellales bacterium]